jgi:hypothetical protein
LKSELPSIQNYKVPIYKEKEKMAEFRKLFYALGLAAMLAGVTTTASAQSINCSRGAGSVPSIVRAESFADLVGDMVLDCTGGTPTNPGVAVPPINVEITLSTNITSKILNTTAGAVNAGGNFTEALLIIDEPNVSPRLARNLLACGDVGAPYNPNGIGVCAIVSNGDPQATYNGSSNTFGAFTCDGVDPDGTGAQLRRPVANSFGCGRPNVFQGRQGFAQNTGNTNIMLFNGVPFDPPGATATDNPQAGHRILRITNIRANSPANLGGFLLQEIRMHVNITGVAGISITEPDVRVASVNIGLQTPLPLTHAADSGITTFVQCLNQTKVPTLRFREGFPASFKVKGLEQTVTNGLYDGFSLRYNGTSIYTPTILNQNVPGANYNTESGFVSTGTNNPSPNNPPLGIGSGNNSTGNGALSNTTGISTAGIATQGTRLAAVFSNMPAGMTVSVANVVNLVQSGTNLVTGVAVRTDVVSPRGDGPFSAYSGSTSVVDGSLVVYEILFADPSVQEDLVINISITNPANQLNSDLPEVNKVAQVAGGFAPFILGTDNTNAWGQAQRPSASVSSGPTFLPVPRFRPGSGAQDLFRVNKCSCNLLFPFVTNFATSIGNFDTGIALANTSLTPGASAAALRFGFIPNTSQSGGVQFWYYPADSTVAPVATQCTNVVATGVCPSPTTGNSAVQAGETLLFSIFGGSGRWGLKPTPGFTGYMIAQASFQYCHAFAYISAQGAGPTSPGMSVGYVALQLDNTNDLPSRTGLPSEVLGH